MNCVIQSTLINKAYEISREESMAVTDKIILAENEAERLMVAKDSNWARAIDTANLVAALEKLRVLNLEAEETVKTLMRETA